MIIDFSSSAFTNLGSQNVIGAITVTKDITGAQVGSRSIVYFVGTGTGSVDLTDFHRVADAIEFDNSPGVLNAVLFTYDGTYYCANCWQGENLIPVDVEPPVVRQVAIREAGELWVRFLETVTGTTSGYTILKGITPVTKSGVTGTNKRTIAISGTTFAFGDTATLAYASGDTVDTSSNALANFTAVTADNLLPDPAAVPTWAYHSTGGIVDAHDGVEKTAGPVYSWTEFARSTQQVSSGQKVRLRNFDSPLSQKRLCFTTVTSPGLSDGQGVQWDYTGVSLVDGAGGGGAIAKTNGEDWWEIWHMGTYFLLYRSEDGVTFLLVADSRDSYITIANSAFYLAAGLSTNGAFQDVQILAQ